MKLLDKSVQLLLNVQNTRQGRPPRAHTRARDRESSVSTGGGLVLHPPSPTHPTPPAPRTHARHLRTHANTPHRRPTYVDPHPAKPAAASGLETLQVSGISRASSRSGGPRSRRTRSGTPVLGPRRPLLSRSACLLCTTVPRTAGAAGPRRRRRDQAAEAVRGLRRKARGRHQDAHKKRGRPREQGH